MSDDDDDVDFWQELASDIAHGRNDENEYCEGTSSLWLKPLATTTNHPNALQTKKKKKCNDETSHYHCYCLRSLDSKHPYKNYVGFTTHAQRRLKQHNGILKHGGAWKTKRGGRPWEFVVVVAGFPTHTMALRFEWAWQHPDKSLVVRAVLGDTAAKTLKRKRGTPGQLCILKTLLERCPKLYDHNPLVLYFIRADCQKTYERALAMPALPSQVVAANLREIESGRKNPLKVKKSKKPSADDCNTDPTRTPPLLLLAPPPVAVVKQIASLEEMPFFLATKKPAASISKPAEHLIQNDDVDSSTRTTERRNGSSKCENQTRGIGDLYHRYCDFQLSDETSSDEEENAAAPNHHNKNRPSMSAARSYSTAIHLDSDNDPGDVDDLSFLTTSLKDMDIRKISSDTEKEKKTKVIYAFDSSSSDSDDFGDCGSRRMLRARQNHQLEHQRSSKPVKNAISIDGFSSSSSSDSEDSSLENEKVSRKPTPKKQNVSMTTRSSSLPLENTTNCATHKTPSIPLPLSKRRHEPKATVYPTHYKNNWGFCLDDDIDDDDSLTIVESNTEDDPFFRGQGTDNYSIFDSVVSSPTTGRSTKTKRLSIVDLCDDSP